MAEMNENPVELFDMYVAHVGINATDPDDAQAISSEFGRLMGFTEYDTPVSLFADTLVEVMKQTGHDIPSLYKETGEGGLAKDYSPMEGH